MGPTPHYFVESGCVCMSSFKPVAPFSFLAHVTFLPLKNNNKKGCGHIDMLKMFLW